MKVERCHRPRKGENPVRLRTRHVTWKLCSKSPEAMGLAKIQNFWNYKLGKLTVVVNW